MAAGAFTKTQLVHLVPGRRECPLLGQYILFVCCLSRPPSPSPPPSHQRCWTRSSNSSCPPIPVPLSLRSQALLLNHPPSPLSAPQLCIYPPACSLLLSCLPIPAHLCLTSLSSATNLPPCPLRRLVPESQLILGIPRSTLIIGPLPTSPWQRKNPLLVRQSSQPSSSVVLAIARPHRTPLHLHLSRLIKLTAVARRVSRGGHPHTTILPRASFSRSVSRKTLHSP